MNATSTVGTVEWTQRTGGRLEPVERRRLVGDLARVVPNVQTRPASPPDLPPPARLHRSPPDDRVRALAVSRWIEHRTGWTIKKFVRTARRYRTIEIQASTHIITAANPLPDDLHHALDRIHHDLRTH